MSINKVSGEIEIKIFNSEDETKMVYEGHDFITLLTAEGKKRDGE